MVALCALQTTALSQGIGSHKGDRGGGTAGGTRSIQGHIISPTGRLPESRIRAGHLYLGITLIGLKQNVEAESELQQAVSLGGDQMGLAHRYLGGLYWAKKDYKRAADEIELYLKLTPKAPDAEQLRGMVKDLRSKS